MWLAEDSIADTKFKLVLVKDLELKARCRGRFDIEEQRIVLPVGSNKKEEIEFCFLHEIAHYLQFKGGLLQTSAGSFDVSLWTFHEAEIENDANRFALKHGAVAGTWYTKSVLRYNLGFGKYNKGLY